MPLPAKAWHDHPVSSPPAFRFLVGGTAPDDVAALRAALAERLAQRGLLPPHGDRPAAVTGTTDHREDGGGGTARPLALLVPVGPDENPDQVRADLAGRILISGPVLAEGYLYPADRMPGAAEDFRESAGRRLLATSDRGRLRPDGRLEVLGRLDDVIITGGVKVEPRRVEEALTSIDAVAEACVVGLPDEQWGSVVAAAVVLEPGGQRGGSNRWDSAALRTTARGRLDGAHTPKRVVALEALPLRPSGKVDRRAVARLIAAAAADGAAEPSTPGP